MNEIRMHVVIGEVDVEKRGGDGGVGDKFKNESIF